MKLVTLIINNETRQIKISPGLLPGYTLKKDNHKYKMIEAGKKMITENEKMKSSADLKRVWKKRGL